MLQSYIFLFFCTARAAYLRRLIDDSKHDPKALFNLFSRLTSTEPISNSSVSADCLADYFVTKIQTLRSGIMQTVSHHITPPNVPLCLDSLPLSNCDEISALVSAARKTFSRLDPFPTKLISSFLPTLLHTITLLLNSSLCTGTVPSTLKHAVVKPLLKKPNADPTNPAKYLPISLLPFLSKILERLVATRASSGLQNVASHAGLGY